MSYLLTKFLPLFVYPLGMAVTLSSVACLVLLFGKKGSAGLLVFLAVVLLWGSSTQKAAEFILHSLERRYPPIPVQEMPSAEAVVILGGVTRGIVPGTDLTDLGDGVDRIVHGAQLFKAGKAPLIILSGGNDPGYQPEAEAMADILKLMAIPAENMLLESKSRNTWQNGVNTAKILQRNGIRTILLVTSASHMRRAEAIFAGLGISVIPAAADYQLVERSSSLLDWMPKAGALEMTTKGIKEYIGYWVYSLKIAVGR